MNKKRKKNIIKDYESEKDEQMVGCEPNSTPTYFHIMESLKRIIREEIDKTLQEPNKDVIQLAIDEYGLTNRLSLGGFILPNGGLLKFSDSNEVRDIDHRNIKGIYTSNNIDIPLDKQYRFSYVVDFMNHGAIRYDCNNGGICFTKEPTKQQYAVIQQIARVNMRNGLYVDIMNSQNGDVIYSFEYDTPMPLKVVKDIQKYFNGGIQQLNEDDRATISFNGQYYDFVDTKSFPFILLPNGDLIYGENQDTHEEAVAKKYLEQHHISKQNFMTNNGINFNKLYALYPYSEKFIDKNIYSLSNIFGRIFIINGSYIIAFDFEIPKDGLENVYYSSLSNNLIPNDPSNVYVNFGGKYHLISEYLNV